MIAIAILVALWFSFNAWNKHKNSEQAAKKQPAQKVVALNSSQINSFTVTARDGTSFTCAKQGNTWSITKPQAITADQGKVASFLQSLTSAGLDQVISPHPANLKDFGLDPPDETIQISSRGKQLTLRLGDDTPTSTGVYAQASDDPRVFTLTEDLKAALEKTLFDLRDTRAVTLDTSKLQRIQAKSGTESYTLVKNPDGAWDVSLPPDVRADHFAVEDLVDNLQGLAMQSIVSEQKKDQASYGFAKPALTMTLVTPDASQTIAVGKKGSGGYYAMNSALNPVFTLDEGSVSQFQKSAADLRDKSLFSWDMLDVKIFDVTTPSTHWVFQHTGDKWRQTAPTSKAIPSDKADALLSALRNLQAASFPAAKPGEMAKFGFSNPSYTFKVQFGPKNQTQAVEVAESGGHIYARRATDPLPCEVSKTDMATIENLMKQL
ncbi:MAG: DUF4340 domain-containing protein [Terriglobia bacterium]